MVFGPDKSRGELEEIIRFLGPYGQRPDAMDVLTRGMRYSPVLRFVIANERKRVFHAQRMTYRGEGGWSWALRKGSISDLAGEFLPHLGKDSFYELI